MRSWLAALRIARREVRRSKGRSALVLALIGLPVLAVTFAAVSYDMLALTPEERVDRRMGAADAQLRWPGDGPIAQRDVTGEWYEGVITDGDHTTAEVEALLPAGSTVVPRWAGYVRLPTATGTGELVWQALDLADPITHGIVRVTGGRAPGGSGEVAVTAAAAERLGVAVGDQLSVPDGTRTVVGVVEFPGELGTVNYPEERPGLRDQVVLFHPDGMPADRWPPRWLVTTPAPIDWEQVLELNQHGITVHSRAVALDPPAGLADWGGTGTPYVPEFGVAVLIAGLVALEIVLLAGPAFAVGARRRQRDLALVAAGGGTPAQLRRIVLADGVVLGTLATALGVVLGIGLALAARPLIEVYLAGARAGGYRIFPAALAGIMLFAVATAVLAALVPAFTAARQQVVDALAGRRGAIRSRRRWLILGLVMVVLGAAAAGGGAWVSSEHVVLAGLILGQLGLALCTPALVGLIARVGPRLRLAPRIALRDTARNRAAAAPAIAAVMAAVAGAVTAGVVLTSLERRYDSVPVGTHVPGTAVVWLEPGSPVTPAEVEQVARATLPVAEIYREWSFGEWTGADGTADPDGLPGWPNVLVPEEKICPYWDRAGALSQAEQRVAAQDPRCAGRSYEEFAPHIWVVADDGTTLPALTGGDPADLAAAAQVLRDGGAVVSNERFLTGSGEVIVGLVDDAGRPLSEHAFTVPGYLLTSGTGAPAVISHEVARTLGWELERGSVLATTERMPSQAEEDAFIAALAELGLAEGFGHIAGRPFGSAGQTALVLLAIAAGLVALGAAAIATGLAAADRRGDLSTLGAVGASPRVRRLLSLNQSGVVAGLGTVLGLAAGLGASVAVLVGMNQQYDGVWPVEPQIPITVPWLHLVGLLAVPVVAMLGAGLLTRSRLPIERRLA